MNTLALLFILRNLRNLLRPESSKDLKDQRPFGGNRRHRNGQIFDCTILSQLAITIAVAAAVPPVQFALAVVKAFRLRPVPSASFCAPRAFPAK